MNQIQNPKGFTLIELLVAVAISSIVLLLVTQVFISTNKMNTIQENVASVQQDIRAAMDIMSTDIMMAGLDPTQTNPTPKAFLDRGHNATHQYDHDTDTDSIALQYDHDGDGTFEVQRCYYYDNTNKCLMIRDGIDDTDSEDDPAPLTDDTQKTSTITVNFSYTLANGSIDTDPDTNGNLDNIRLVTVQICGEIAGTYAADHPNTYCFSKTIKPRNL